MMRVGIRLVAEGVAGDLWLCRHLRETWWGKLDSPLTVLTWPADYLLRWCEGLPLVLRAPDGRAAALCIDIDQAVDVSLFSPVGESVAGERLAWVTVDDTVVARIEPVPQ